VKILRKALTAAALSLAALSLNSYQVTAATLETTSLASNNNYIRPVITVEEAVEVQKSNIFDAAQSFIPEESEPVTYTWDFGDGSVAEGVEVLHSYSDAGEYTVTLIISNGRESKEISNKVFVFRKNIFLITDSTESKQLITKRIEDAKQQGVYIRLIETFGSSTEFISEEILSQKLVEQMKNLQKADQILIWTKETAGLSALQGALNNSGLNISDRTIIVIKDDINGNISRLTRQFNLLKPSRIIVTQEAATFPLIESSNDDEFLATIKQKGYKYSIITEDTGKLRPWNFMSYFTNTLRNKGIPDSAVALLLLLPVIATVVTFMRQVIGITTFGIYTPSIITLSFLIVGIYAGILTLGIALIVAFFSRVSLKKLRMLYIPKMALVICIVSLSIMIFLVLSIHLHFFDLLFNPQSLSIVIFPLVILSTLAEKFISAENGKSLFSIMKTMMETVFVAIVAYIVVGGAINLGLFTLQIDIFKKALIVYPELIFLIMIFNAVLGKWTGLRLLERYRFREILKNNQE